MKLYKINFYNSIILIVMGFWGYVEVSSPTALIPVAFGTIIGLLTQLSKQENKSSKITVIATFVLTLLILLALVGMRLPKSFSSGGIGFYRVLIMILSSSISSGYFIKHLIFKR